MIMIFHHMDWLKFSSQHKDQMVVMATRIKTSIKRINKRRQSWSWFGTVKRVFFSFFSFKENSRKKTFCFYAGVFCTLIFYSHFRIRTPALTIFTMG